MRSLIRPLVVVAVLFAIVACATAIDRIVGPAESPERAAARLGAAAADFRTVFGPRVFTRETSAPVTETATIEGFAPSAILRIENGDATGARRVTSGSVLVDGVEVVHPADFKQHDASLAVPITLRNASTIAVQLAGSPGERLTLRVDGEPATAGSMTAGGGTLHLLGSEVTLVAPAGAVAGNLEITAVPTPAPRAEVIPGTSFDMGPGGTTFASPVTLSIAFDPAKLPAGVQPSSLRMKWWNLDHWEGLPGNIVDLQRSVVSATTTHFTTFALLANEVLFCPGDASAISDLRTAITQVPANGTVYVCDGSFPVAQVLIDKPMTLRSLNPGGATLTDAESGGTFQAGAPILRIDGVTSGLVRVADISLVVKDLGITPSGTYDRVAIDSVTFSGTPGTESVALRIETSSVAAARVDVSASDFSGLTLGVWPIAGTETNVRGSRFDRFTAGALSYSFNSSSSANGQSWGRIEDNTFTNCASTGCIRILTARDIVVARNRFEAMDQAVSLGAITLQITAPPPSGASTIIEDNVIVSRRTADLATSPSGWMFQSGIYVSDASNIPKTIRRNRITDAYSALTSSGSLNATDNWISGGVYALRQTAIRTTIFQRNDVVGLIGAFTVPTIGSSVQCNWWGSTAGPTAPPTGQQAVYTPWAAEPIAGTSLACDATPVPPLPPIATLSVLPSQTGLVPGGSLTFSVSARDANGNLLPVSPVWSVVNGGGTISATGQFTAGAAPGTYTGTVRATADGISATATVIVGEIAGIALTSTSASILTGATQQFTAVGRDASGNSINLPQVPAWSVVNGGGTVSANGLFTAGVEAGVFANTVKATYGAFTATASVTVYDLAGLSVSPTSVTLSPGASRQFTATGRDASGATFAVAPSWSVANGGGTITSNGFFTAGTTTGTYANTVMASLRGFSATATVTVGSLASITISPSSSQMLGGSTRTFTATGRDASGNVVALPSPVWSVVNGGGTINASTGLFTAGNTAGTFTNTIKVTSGSVSATTSVTVLTLQSLYITPGPLNIATGASRTFVALGRAAGNIYFAIAPAWSVTNGGGAINASSGLFTAGPTLGTFANTVTATYGSLNASVSVTVTLPPTSLIVTPSPATLQPGASVQFYAEGRDAGGGKIPVTPIWSVANGGGTIAADWGSFTAGAAIGTFANTVVATVDNLTTATTVNVVNPSATVRVCATGGTGLTVGTLAEAYALVTSGGTIVLCDGRYAVNDLVIAKPVTITAEGPGTPQIEPMGTSSQFWVSGRTPGTVTISRLSLRGITVQTDTGATAQLIVENNAFEDCGTYQCISSSIASRVVNNTFTAHIEHPVSSAVNLGAWQGSSPISYTVTDNTITGVGNDPTQANMWSRYAITSAAVSVGSGVAEVSRNHITNTFWGVIASPYPSRPALTMTAVDNVVQTTWFPIGRIGPYAYGGSVTMNWNDVLDYGYTSPDSSSGNVNMRCNWWGRATGPLNVNASAQRFYNPYATSPVAGQSRTDCDPTGAALSSIAITPNPDTLVAGGTQQFVAAGRDGNGQVIPVTASWSIVNGGGTIDPSTGVFTAGAFTGTYWLTVKATSGLVSGTATVVVTPPPPAAVVRVCSTSGSDVTVPTLAEALTRVMPGGTVRICDGTHVANNLVISKPVTITAEGPGRPTIDAGAQQSTWWVPGSIPGTVVISNLQFKGQMVVSEAGTAGTSLTLDGNTFDDCALDNACVILSTPSRIVRNTFRAHIDHHVNVALVLGSQVAEGLTYTVADNQFEGVGFDSTQTNTPSQYPFLEAIELRGGVADVSGNRISNAYWGVVAIVDASRPAPTLTAVDNVVQTTYFPIGRVGDVSLPALVTANWNDISDFHYLESDLPAGTLNLRCNWWGQGGGPTNVADSVLKVYAPYATAPVAGQAHTGCEPNGVARANLTHVPNSGAVAVARAQHPTTYAKPETIRGS